MHLLDVLYEASEVKPDLQAPALQSQTATLSSDHQDPLRSSETKFYNKTTLNVKMSHFG